MRDWSYFDAGAMIGPSLVPLPASIPDAAALLSAMDHYGIDRALFYHNASSKSEMNRLTLASARASDRLAPCWVLPLTPVDLDEKLEDHVDRMLAAGVKAARLVPDEGPAAGPMTLRMWALEEVLARLSRHRVPLMIDADHLQTPAAVATYGWDQIDAICTRFPDLPLILLQPRYAAQTALIPLLRRHPNLHFTVTWFGLHRQLESFVGMFGPRRMLFGTHLPHGDPGLALGAVSYGKLTPEEKTQIAGGNLRRLLGGVR